MVVISLWKVLKLNMHGLLHNLIFHRTSNASVPEAHIILLIYLPSVTAASQKCRKEKGLKVFAEHFAQHADHYLFNSVINYQIVFCWL